MKICFHTNFEIKTNYIGGTERFLIKLSKELKVLGFEPFIVCSSLQQENEVEGIKVYGAVPAYIRSKFQQYKYFSSEFLRSEIIGSTPSVNSLKNLSFYTQQQLAGFEADVYHLNSFASASFLTPYSRFFVTNHENEREYDGYWGDGFFNMLCRIVQEKKCELHKFSGLLTPSYYYSKLFSHAFQLTVSNIKLGVHLSDFPYADTDSINKSETTILFPARFQTKQKGHDIAIKAGAILKDKGLKFRIIFTGIKESSEKYFENFYELVDQYDMREYILLKTYSDINDAYGECDIVISPEKYCSYGLSISESLALGIPTILSDIPTYLEIANGFEHAVFFNSEYPNDLAEKIIGILQTGKKRNRLDAIKFRKANDIRLCAQLYSDLYTSSTKI